MTALAGQKIKATDLPPGTWADYTPVWSAATTNPVLGNGSAVGRWTRYGNVVHVLGRVQAGSTTTFGTGAYGWSLPVASYDAIGGNSVIGSCWIRDASGADFPGECINGGTTFSVRPAASTFGGNAVAGPTAPMTWASGDFISFHLTYEAAP